jgi:hypothetical protein
LQRQSLLFLFAENEKFVGRWHILDIALDKNFIKALPSQNFLIEKREVASFFPERKKVQS